MSTRKSAFISYAHKDGLEFTRRLAYALSIYMDVFWDRRLPATTYPEELEAQIEQRDFLIFIMTPFSIDSEWCRRELAHAEKHGKGIVLAQVFSGAGTTDPDLASRYTYGDFSEDFDSGFRRITTMMLGLPFSSWEYLADGDDPSLIASLQNGVLPGVIAKNVAEWLIVDILWAYVESMADDFERRKQGEGHQVTIRRGHPRTPRGVLISLDDVAQRFRGLGYRVHVGVINDMTRTASNAMQQIADISDDDNRSMGNGAFNLFLQVRGNMGTQNAKVLDPFLAKYVREYLEFDLAEKLRELINMYARRSKYLY